MSPRESLNHLFLGSLVGNRLGHTTFLTRLCLGPHRDWAIGRGAKTNAKKLEQKYVRASMMG
jgi:hypothetical protein